MDHAPDPCAHAALRVGAIRPGRLSCGRVNLNATAARTARILNHAVPHSAPLRYRRAVFHRDDAVLRRSRQHLSRDHSARAPLRLRRRRAGTYSVGFLLGLLLHPARGRMDVRSFRRTPRARRGRCHLVARNAFDSASRGDLVSAAVCDSRSPGPWRGCQLSRDSQPDRALDAGVGAGALAVAQL